MGREHGSSDSMTHAQTHWLQNKHGSLLQNPLDLIPLSGMLETQALRSGRGALAFSPSQLPGRIPVEPPGASKSSSLQEAPGSLSEQESHVSVI